jgi:hypothetical protein
MSKRYQALDINRPRFRGSIAAVAAITTFIGVSFVAPPAASADEIFLGPQSTLPFSMAGSADPNTLILYRFDVPASTEINYATAYITFDPELMPTRLVVYPNSGAGTSGWSPTTTFSQVSSSLDAASSAYDTRYTGSFIFSPGSYWIGVSPVNNDNQGYRGAQGGQTSPWTWSTAAANQYYTLNAGATWLTTTDTSWPMITLEYRSAPLVLEPATTPADWLQQVALPPGGCESFEDEALSIAGISGSTGWTQSWSQWVNDGIGGPVCTRTLTFNPNQSKWVVG